jgi:hypothetical protein
MEIVLPGVMTVMESHDIALALQHKIESLEDVERAFVHVSMYSDDDALSVTCSLLATYLPTYLPFLVPGHTYVLQVDHEKRDGLEHKVERELVNSSTLSSSPDSPLIHRSTDSASRLSRELQLM